MSQDSYGDAFGKRFGAASAPAFVTRTLRKSEVAVTYLRQITPTHELSAPQPIEDAYLVSYVLQDNPIYTIWENGRAVPPRPVLAGETTFNDLKTRPVMHVNSPMDALHFYVPRVALDTVADNEGVSRIDQLNYPHGGGVDDRVMRGLSTAMLSAFDQPERSSRLFIDHITLAVVAHVAHVYGAMRVAVSARGGLAPWQEKRAKEILDEHLDGNLSPTTLAGQCGLSASHFARSFRISTGLAPHQWLLQRRVDRAKQALRDRQLSLTSIALECGFADQSHFTRVFTRLIGISPGAWRRKIFD